MPTLSIIFFNPFHIGYNFLDNIRQTEIKGIQVAEKQVKNHTVQKYVNFHR